MKNLSEAFAAIFSDDDWFNKVLVGGLCVFFVFCGFGIVLINGYLVEFMKSILKGNRDLPFWRDFPKIIRTGWKVSFALILYYGIITIALYFFGIPVISLTVAVTYFILHTTLHPLVLLAYAQSPAFGSCFNPMKIFKTVHYAGRQIVFVLLLSAALLFLSITIGWMAIVVGWTLLVFLSLLIQNAAAALAIRDHLASHS